MRVTEARSETRRSTGATAACASAVIALILAGRSTAGSSRSLPEIAASLSLVEQAAVAARRGEPEAVQRRYDSARSLADELAGITPSNRCAVLYHAVARALRGHVLASEGFDRRSDSLRARGEREAAAGRAQAAAAGRCTSPGLPARRPRPRPLLSPLEGEAFFGEVRAACLPTPRGSSSAGRGSRFSG